MQEKIDWMAPWRPRAFLRMMAMYAVLWFAGALVMTLLALLAGCGAQPGNPLQGPLIGQIDNTDWAAISQATGDLMRKK